jgi:uncharacterized protein (DUF488 family)
MTAACAGDRAVHTIGHSTRSIEELLALLAGHSIQRVVDVRRWPTSRRFPHFRREALMESLRSVRIEYVWRADLGGYRTPAGESPNTAWRTGAFRAYADFMRTLPFEAAIGDLERLAAAQRIAVMCAEAVPWRCHRQLLADAFTVRGWPVRHVLDDGCHEHHLPPFARPRGTQILYPARDDALPPSPGLGGEGKSEGAGC